MEGKLYLLITYTLIGISIALWPTLVKEKLVHLQNPQFYGLIEPSIGWMWKSACFAMATIGVILLSGKSITTIILSFALIAFALSLANKEFDVLVLLTTFLALCTSITLLWWRRQGSSLSVDKFSLIITCFSIFALDYVFKIKKPSIKEHGLSLKWIIPYVLLATIMSFSTGILHNSSVFTALWIHWGAYIAPAELLLSGATIFHDFPAQYGLGPTALIASVCGRDCWQGMYFIASFSILIFSTLTTILALALTRKHWTERLTVLALSVAMFFWTSSPAFTNSPIVVPSASGLRFSPVTLMVTYLFFIKKIEYSKVKMFVAHCFWIFGSLWSPESAFYVTCVWWPYYIFIQRTQGKFWLRCKGLINSLMSLLLLSLGLVIAFNLVFRLIYHTSPTFYGFLVHILNPPAAMPADFHGAIWYFLLILIIGVSTLIHLWNKSGDSHLFRSGLLLTLLNYSVFSYFLGRSHDAVVLSILPFMLLVALHAISAIDSKKLNFIIKASIISLAVILGWLPTFGWEGWRSNIRENRLFSFGPKFIIHSIPTLNKSTYPNSNLVFQGALPADALRAINFIQRNYNEPFTVLNGYHPLVDIRNPTAVWNGMHGPANYAVIPPPYNRMFLNLTAAALNRSGWLIIDQDFSAESLLADFDFVYQRTKQLEFGRYYAIHFIPKT